MGLGNIYAYTFMYSLRIHFLKTFQECVLLNIACDNIINVFAAVPLGLVLSQPDTLLSSMRKEVERLYCKPQNEFNPRSLAESWCFLDSECKISCICDFIYSMQWPVAVQHVQIGYIAFNLTKRTF